MKILLIGGSGVLSSAVAREAVKRGHFVTTVTRGNRIPEAGVESIVCDCRDYARLSRIIGDRSFDVVVDFLSFDAAGVVSAYTFFAPIAKQFVFISSAFVYDFSCDGTFSESSQRRFRCWRYSLGKSDAEDAIDAIKNKQCGVTVVRPMVTYGDTRIPYGLGPRHGFDWTLVARLRAGKPIVTWNGGRNRCTIMRSEEFAVGLVGLLGNRSALGQVYNICGDESPSWMDVLVAVARYAGCELKTVDMPVEYIAKNYPEKGEEIYGRSVDAVVDNAKIKGVVSEFRQTVLLDEGVRETLRSYEDNGFKCGIDWRYDGYCDKLISGYCTCGPALRFVDYLGTATLRDRYTYWSCRNQGRVRQKVVSGIFRLCSMIVRSLKLSSGKGG